MGDMSIPLQFASLCDGEEGFVCISDCLLDLGTDFLVGSMFFVRDTRVVSCGSTSFTRHLFFFVLCCEVYDLQAYRKMDVTRERISRILEVTEMLFSFNTGFNHVNAVVVCAILESISGLDPHQLKLSPGI